MKTKKWFFVMVSWMLILAVSCVDKMSDEEQIKLQASRKTINEIAQALAADPSWIDAETIENLKRGPVKAEEITASPALAKAISSGKYVEIELYHNSNTNVLAKGLGASSYYVGLDPDTYHFPKDVEEEITGIPTIEMPAYYLTVPPAMTRPECPGFTPISTVRPAIRRWTARRSLF